MCEWCPDYQKRKATSPGARARAVGAEPCLACRGTVAFCVARRLFGMSSRGLASGACTRLPAPAELGSAMPALPPHIKWPSRPTMPEGLPSAHVYPEWQSDFTQSGDGSVCVCAHRDHWSRIYNAHRSARDACRGTETALRVTFVYDSTDAYHLRALGYAAVLSQMKVGRGQQFQVQAVTDRQLMNATARIQPAHVCICQKRACLGSIVGQARTTLEIDLDSALARVRCARIIIDLEDLLTVITPTGMSARHATLPTATGVAAALGLQWKFMLSADRAAHYRSIGDRSHLHNSLQIFADVPRLLGAFVASCDAKLAFARRGIAAAVVPHHHTNMDVVLDGDEANAAADALTRVPVGSIAFVGTGKRVRIAASYLSTLQMRYLNVACSIGVPLLNIVQASSGARNRWSSMDFLNGCPATRNVSNTSHIEYIKSGFPERFASNAGLADTPIMNFSRQAAWAIDPALRNDTIGVMITTTHESPTHQDPQKLLTWWARGVPTISDAKFSSHRDAMRLAGYYLPDGNLSVYFSTDDMERKLKIIAGNRAVRHALIKKGLQAARHYHVAQLARVAAEQVGALLHHDHARRAAGFRFNSSLPSLVTLPADATKETDACLHELSASLGFSRKPTV